MCSIAYAEFIYSSGTIISGCNVNSTDAVQLHCTVQFTSAEMGQQFYAKFYMTTPQGAYDTYSSNITVNYSTMIFSSSNLPLTAGTWAMSNFEIYTAQGVLQCSGSGKSSLGLCESINVTGSCAAPSACSVTGPTTVTQGTGATYTCNWTGSGTYNVDFYKDGAYWKSVTNVTGTSASINQTMDATTFPVGTHTIAANLYCVSATNLSCATTVISINVVSPCATPSISLSMT